MRIRLLAFPVAILSFALGLGAAQVQAWFSADEAPAETAIGAGPCGDPDAVYPRRDITVPIDQTVIDYCELASHPDRYNGQTVRFRATLSGFIHGMYFSRRQCAMRVEHAAAFYYPPTAGEIKRSLDLARRSTKTSNWLVPVDIVATGKFFKVNPTFDSDTVYDTASFQIELISIESANVADLAVIPNF